MRQGCDQPIGFFAFFRIVDRAYFSARQIGFGQKQRHGRPAQPDRGRVNRKASIGEAKRGHAVGHRAIGPANRRFRPAFGCGDGHMRASGQLDTFMLAGASGQPDGKVKIGFGKIDRLVRRHQSEARVGVRLAECRQPRGQPFGGKIAWRSDGQRIGGLPRLHRADGLFELQKARTQGIKAICRFIRQFKPLGRPAE